MQRRPGKTGRDVASRGGAVMTSETMTLPRRDGAAPSVRERRPLRRWLSESVVLFVVFAAAYLAVAVLLVRQNILFADAMSRVGNAYYVLFSRDPHLPALGFVWNPLPSLVLLPILPLKSGAPWLVSYGFAGAIESALMMAGTVALLAGCLRKMGVPRVARLVITVLFAVQPMILLYAGSGLSEAMMLFFLTLATSCLVSWLQTRSPGALVGAGLALGLTYMARYEAIAPAFGVTVLVGIVTWAQTKGGRSARLAAAGNDVALVAGPFVFAFAIWSVMARVIVGQWLPTFSSAYGNSAQVASGAQSIQSVTGDTVPATLDYIGRQVQGLAPLFVVLLLAAAVLAFRARSLPALAAPVVFGAVSAFNALVLLMGSSFGWLRFQITVIPLTAILAGTVIALGLQEMHGRKAAVPPDDVPATGTFTRTFHKRRVAAAIGTVLVAAAVAVSIPVQIGTLTDTQTGLAREESPMLHSAISPDLATHEEQRSLLIFHTERQIAAYIDNLNPGDGTVLTDTAYAYSVVMASSRPHQFVITSDLDFAGAVADPAGHGVKYLLVPAPNLGPADALKVRWPGLYDNGGGISTLVQTFSGAFFGDWRLYRVN